MNDSELENELRALLPVAPSPHLAERIGRQLAASRAAAPTAGVITSPARTRATFGWLWNLGWAGAGAAVAVTAITIFSLVPQREKSAVTAVDSSNATQLAALMPNTTASVPSAATSTPQSVTASTAAEDQAFEPTQTSRELIAVDDSDELLETADGPVREVRYTYVERLAWAHPTTGARLEIEVPREDVYLMPVSLQ